MEQQNMFYACTVQYELYLNSCVNCANINGGRNNIAVANAMINFYNFKYEPEDLNYCD